MQRKTQTTDFQQMERLADKIKALVDILERTREELSQKTQDNQHRQHEIESMREKLSTNVSTDKEMTTLLSEREQIKSRVNEMLEQLEGINL